MRWLTTILAAFLSAVATAQYSVQVMPNIVYTSASGYPQVLDVYRPATSVQSRRPCIVMVHGGGWSGGSKEDFAGWANYYAARGYVCATINYRLAPQHVWPAQIDDTQASVRFMRKNAAFFGLDPKRMGTIGASAGGHLVQYLGATDTLHDFDPVLSGYSSRVSVVIDFVGPCDLTREAEWDPNIYFLIAQMIGGTYQQNPDAYRDASPVNLVSPGDAYAVLFYGHADTIVPISQGRQLDQRMTENGVPHQFFDFPGQGHGFDGPTFDFCVKVQNKALDSRLMLRSPKSP